ncbi:intracellular coagulation inhibitor 2-like isoform X2 [Ornithodoros turicata]|uniref:intracellular coagulation inhibitor 2-like isoform X2 n=1 Tax=Ornithodoros turicata TaxID=34597 RepID=UPI0031391755
MLLVLLIFAVVTVRCATTARIERLAEASNNFAFDLVGTLHKDGKNVFFSPFSVSVAMAMLYAGARGKTAKELRSSLGYSKAGLYKECDVLLSLSLFLHKFGHREKGVILAVANAAVVDKKFRVADSYTDNLQEAFEAELYEADFENYIHRVAVSQEIDAWVSNQTRGIITTIGKGLSRYTALVLLNAVYFKGYWFGKFDKRMTKKLPFFNHGRTSTLVETMVRKGNFGFYGSAELRADVVELPYEGQEFSMVIVLPYERDGVSNVLRNFTASTVYTVMRTIKTTKILLQLPKFKLEAGYALKQALTDIGVTSVFGPEADLGGISRTKGLKVSDVLHKAVIEVNEEGSEAAAATEIIPKKPSPIPMEIPIVHVDHPFVFWVLNKETGMVMFLGVVNELH